MKPRLRLVSAKSQRPGPVNAQNPAAPRTGENTGFTSGAYWLRPFNYGPVRGQGQPDTSNTVVNPDTNPHQRPFAPTAQPTASGNPSSTSSRDPRCE